MKSVRNVFVLLLFALVSLPVQSMCTFSSQANSPGNELKPIVCNSNSWQVIFRSAIKSAYSVVSKHEVCAVEFNRKGT